MLSFEYYYFIEVEMVLKEFYIMVKECVRKNVKENVEKLF